MVRKLQYFGTSPTNYGHFVWDLNRGFVGGDLPSLIGSLDFYRHKNNPFGYSEFEVLNGYSLLRITGSCTDKRSGTVSCFFVNGICTKQELLEMISTNRYAMQVFAKFPQDVVQSIFGVSEQPTECPIAKAVAADILQRSKKGIEKYGTTLARTDLSLVDWLQHAYEETLDKANYLKRAIEELKNQQQPTA